MKKTTKQSDPHPPIPRNLQANSHVIDSKETRGFREGLRDYMPAWRAANIQKAYIKLKRDQLMRKGGPVRHPVLIRDLLK